MQLIVKFVSYIDYTLSMRIRLVVLAERLTFLFHVSVEASALGFQLLFHLAIVITFVGTEELAHCLAALGEIEVIASALHCEASVKQSVAHHFFDSLSAHRTPMCEIIHAVNRAYFVLFLKLLLDGTLRSCIDCIDNAVAFPILCEARLLKHHAEFLLCFKR